MTYALLIYSSLPPGSSLPPETEAAALERHRALQRRAAERGELHAVARLDSESATRIVRRQDDELMVTDGPFMESKEWLVGFYLLDCANESEAVERAGSLCLDEAHSIEVRPVSWRWRL